MISNANPSDVIVYWAEWTHWVVNEWGDDTVLWMHRFFIPQKHFEDKGDRSAGDPRRASVAVTPHPAPSVMKRRHGLVTAEQRDQPVIPKGTWVWQLLGRDFQLASAAALADWQSASSQGLIAPFREWKTWFKGPAEILSVPALTTTTYTAKNINVEVNSY